VLHLLLESTILKTTKDAIYERDPNYKTFEQLVQQKIIDDIQQNGYYEDANNKRITNIDSVKNNVKFLNNK
jgi:hypothetical protein